MIGDHLSHRKVSSRLLLQLDTLAGDLTLPSLVTWSKATGLQMVSEVRFLETILAFFDYFPGHTIAQVRLIFRLLRYDIFSLMFNVFVSPLLRRPIRPTVLLACTF